MTARESALEIASDAILRRARVLDALEPDVAEELRRIVTALDPLMAPPRKPPPALEEFVLAALKKGPFSVRELARDIWGDPTAAGGARMGFLLQAMRRRGLVVTSGKTKAAKWHRALR